MKKLTVLFLSLLLFLNLSQLSAQQTGNYNRKSTQKEKRIENKNVRKELRKLEGNKVSTLSMRNFTEEYGHIPNVKWTRTTYYDVAQFILKKNEIKAYYDKDGERVGTTHKKTMDDLPDKGVKTLNGKYKDYKIGTILYFENNDVNNSPMVLWGTQIMNRSNYFVELTKEDQKMVVAIDPGGNVTLFKKL